MPIYEYHCSRCGARFEKIKRESSQEEPCPTCGAVARRAISLPAASPSSGGGGCSSSSGFS